MKLTKVPFLDQSSTSDHNTTTLEYNANKPEILKHLRAKGDPFPFVVNPGQHREELAFRETSARLAKLRSHGVNVTLLRGYRLTTIHGLAQDSGLLYNASPCLVLKVGTVYECLSCNRDPDSNAPIVFVPSSRMHPELTDTQLLSGSYLCCTVVGGAPMTVRALLVARNALSFFEQRKLCATPEEGVPRRLLLTRTFPLFSEWMSTCCKLPFDLITDFSISSGCCFREILDEEAEEALRVVGEGGVYDFGTEDPSVDMTAPDPPWVFERETWLFSVGALHDFYLESSKGTNALQNFELVSTFYLLYNKLQDEYLSRLHCGDTFAPPSHACATPTTSQMQFV